MEEKFWIIGLVWNIENNDSNSYFFWELDVVLVFYKNYGFYFLIVLVIVIVDILVL